MTLACLSRELGPKLRRDGQRDSPRGPRARMQIAFQVPTGIKRHPNIGYSRFIENSAPKHLLGGTLGAELRIDNQRYCAVPACQGGAREQFGACRLNALFDFRFAMIGHHKPEE
jgi:hypothetical protein